MSLIRHSLSPKATNDILTGDRAVLVASMVARFMKSSMREILRPRQTYPFPYLIFELFKAAGVPIWHIDVFRTPTGKVDIGLIRIEVNSVASGMRSMSQRQIEGPE